MPSTVASAPGTHPVESWFGAPFGGPGRQLLQQAGERLIGDRVLLYAADKVVERNECYQTRDYCPGFLAIGDDGGGRAIVIDPRLPEPQVFIVDHGDMTPGGFEAVASSLSDWLAQGCPLPNDGERVGA